MTSEFHERLKKISQRNLRVRHQPGKHWPMEKKIEAVSQYLVTGNMKMVSALTGISYDLLAEWKRKPWWAELEAEIRTSQNVEMDSKLTKIVDKSLDAVLDRVENGDFIYDQKSGEIRRKPVALKDVHRVSVDMISKRELIRQEKAPEVAKLSVEDQLKLLAQEFAKWVDKKPTSEVIDVETVEVVQPRGDAGENSSDDGFRASDEMAFEGDEGGTSSGPEDSFAPDDFEREGESSNLDQPETKA